MIASPAARALAAGSRSCPRSARYLGQLPFDGLRQFLLFAQAFLLRQTTLSSLP
ncbi:MAG: hypothetical protein AB1445_05425 [Bacillota bacterium]